MTDTLLKAAGIALTGAFSALLLKEKSRGAGVAVSLCAFIVIRVSSIGGTLLQIIDTCRGILEGGPVSEYAPVLLKALAVCYITYITADICRGAGEESLAGAVVLTGKLQLMALAMPL
ncbi:MAG: hypothetical protein IKL24_04140, partial [Clostridia bacterium]|nr:hypothetical protein [Clostridia bacterium]